MSLNRADRRTAARKGARAPRTVPAPRTPDPLPGTHLEELTDRFGDKIRVSPAGAGHVLIEIEPADPSQPCASVELPSTWIPKLFVGAVKATGKSPEQLVQR